MSDERNQPDHDEAYSRLTEAIDWLLAAAVIALAIWIAVLFLK